MTTRSKKWLKNSLRWGIAVFGIWYVLSNMSWYDRVLVSGRGGWPVALRLTGPAEENATAFSIVGEDGSAQTIPRDQLLARVDFARITVNENGRSVKYDLLAQKVMLDSNRDHWPLLVCSPRNLWQRYWNLHSSPIHYIHPRQIEGPHLSSVPYPLIDRGIRPKIKHADSSL